MNIPVQSFIKVRHAVIESTDRFCGALAREWQSIQDASLDRAHGATLHDRPFAGSRPCDPVEFVSAMTPAHDAKAEHRV